jgi:hypothetical protein
VTVPLETLVAELRTLSKKIGSLTSDALTDTPSLTSLPRYLDYSVDQIRREALLSDLEEAVATLPDDQRDFARLLFSYDAPGTNITHRRKLAGMGPESKPTAVTKWREHYIFALIASRLMAAAGRSRIEESGPGYRHEKVTYRVTITDETPSLVTSDRTYDIRMIRDGVYVFLIGERPAGEGELVEPWRVTSGQFHVGDASLGAGTEMHVVYLGRRYVTDEQAHIATRQVSKKEIAGIGGSAGITTGHRPSALLIEVFCPLRLVSHYDRLELDGTDVNAAPRSKRRIERDSEGPMTYDVSEASPLTRYAIHWTVDNMA